MGTIRNIGDEMKARRKTLAITQRTLAELSGVGINTLTRIEQGEGNLTLEVLEKIADTLGMELHLKVRQQ